MRIPRDRNHPQAKALFLDALEQPAQRRARFVRAAAGGDEALRRRVEALLVAHARSAPLERLAAAARGAIRG